MIDLAQEGYTNEEVLKLLKMNRMIKYEYKVLNQYGKSIGRLDAVKSGSITCNSEASIVNTGAFVIKKSELMDFNNIDYRLMPIFCIMAPNGKWLKYPLGVFILSTPVEEYNDGAVYCRVEGYGLELTISEDKLIQRLFLAKGTPYTAVIRQMINSTGITNTNIQDSDLCLVTDMEYDIGTPKIDIVNELASAINYTSVYTDYKGFMNCYSKKNLHDATVNHTYKVGKDSIILPGSQHMQDSFEVANRFIRYIESPERGTLISQYDNTNDRSALSITRRGRIIVDVERVNDIADQNTLDEYTKNEAIRKSQVIDKVVFSTAVMPNHGYQDCIKLVDNRLGVSDKYIEYSYSMELAPGGKMQHTCYKVVEI